jgi:hypothetical protein
MSPGFVLGRPPSDEFLKNSLGDHETQSIWCHVGIHVDVTIHLAFT